MRHISDEERRRRLARRHGLAAAHRFADSVAATRGMTVLHSTEAANVHLALAARVEGLAALDVDRELYVERSLVKQLAMRRTLFVFPRELLAAAWASAGARTAEFERRKIVKDLEASGVTSDGDAWLGEVKAEVLRALEGRSLSARELRVLVPQLAQTVVMAPGTRWGGEFPVGPRILAWLGARSDIVRGPNDGGWWVSRPRWTPMQEWLTGGGWSDGEPGQPADPGGQTGMAAPDSATGYRELIRSWLWTFGPGTETDIVWWLGATKAAVRKALAELHAVPVTLDAGVQGWVLPEDEDATPTTAPWAALLPSLDPTTMGWKERDFYLDPEDVPFLVDSAGNAGTTAWLDGRVVGCWIQDTDGTVRVVLRRPVPLAGQALLDAEARRLSHWLDGRVISSVYMARQRSGTLLP